MPTRLARTLLSAAALTAGATALTTTEPSAVGDTRASCPPKAATRVFARDWYGAVYRQRYDGVGLRSCARDGTTSYTSDSSTEFGPQIESFDIGGRFYAYAAAVCDIDDPCLTNVLTSPLGGYRLRSAVTMLPSAPPVSDQAYVTRLRIAANQAFAWIVCEGGPFGRTPPGCLRDGHRRWLYVRPASQAFEDVAPTLVATGHHLDPRFLRLSHDGTEVTWRQQGRPRSRDIGG